MGRGSNAQECVVIIHIASWLPRTKIHESISIYITVQITLSQTIKK